jgi:hypothetical protein
MLEGIPTPFTSKKILMFNLVIIKKRVLQKSVFLKKMIIKKESCLVAAFLLWHKNLIDNMDNAVVRFDVCLYDIGIVDFYGFVKMPFFGVDL